MRKNNTIHYLILILSVLLNCCTKKENLEPLTPQLEIQQITQKGYELTIVSKIISEGNTQKILAGQVTGVCYTFDSLEVPVLTDNQTKGYINGQYFITKIDTNVFNSNKTLHVRAWYGNGQYLGLSKPILYAIPPTIDTMSCPLSYNQLIIDSENFDFEQGYIDSINWDYFQVVLRDVDNNIKLYLNFNQMPESKIYTTAAYQSDNQVSIKLYRWMNGQSKIEPIYSGAKVYCKRTDTHLEIGTCSAFFSDDFGGYTELSFKGRFKL